MNNLNENLSQLFGINPIEGFVLDEIDCEPLESLCGENNSFYGCKHTEESKQLMSEAAKARPSNRKGVRLSEEAKALISLNSAHAKKIQTPYGLFESKVEAAEVLNTTTETLRTILNEKLDKKVTRASIVFRKEDVGKTPRELGWCYV